MDIQFIPLDVRQVVVFEHPGQIRPGYCPAITVHTSQAGYLHFKRQQCRARGLRVESSLDSVLIWQRCTSLFHLLLRLWWLWLQFGMWTWLCLFVLLVLLLLLFFVFLVFPFLGDIVPLLVTAIRVLFALLVLCLFALLFFLLFSLSACCCCCLVFPFFLSSCYHCYSAYASSCCYCVSSPLLFSSCIFFFSFLSLLTIIIFLFFFCCFFVFFSFFFSSFFFLVFVFEAWCLLPGAVWVRRTPQQGGSSLGFNRHTSAIVLVSIPECLWNKAAPQYIEHHRKIIEAAKSVSPSALISGVFGMCSHAFWIFLTLPKLGGQR